MRTIKRVIRLIVSKASGCGLKWADTDFEHIASMREKYGPLWRTHPSQRQLFDEVNGEW